MQFTERFVDGLMIRPEVIEARRSRKAGAIVLARPVPMRAAAGFAGAVTLALGLLLGVGEYTSKVRVTGQLAPIGGAIKVVAAQFGTITARKVKEGQAVTAGQVLFELSSERIGSSGSVDARIGASLGTRREQILQRRDVSLQQLTQRARALSDQRHMVEGEIATHTGAIAIEDELVKSARTNLRRYATLAQKGFVSPAQLAQTTNALNVELAKRNALTLNLSNARRTLSQVLQESAALAGQAEIAASEAKQSLAALEQETAEHDGRSAIRVAAPAGGIVTALGYAVGQSVPVGTVLATVLPAGAVLEAQLLVPSRAKAAIERGQQVQLRIDAFPYQKYGLVPGIVEQVELNPINDGAPGATPAAPMYRATVALSTNALMVYGKRKPFEAGMSLEADIFQDRRRLIEWVFDPLISATKGRAP
jgi:membrane fusion protein